MTDQEILYESIKIAVINGYLKPGTTTHFYNALDRSCKNEAHWYYESNSFYQLIFSHDFAKAFWGEFHGHGEPFGDGEAPDGFTESGFPKCKKDWRFHIQQIVLWENPLHYLATFLKSACCNDEIEYTPNSGVYVTPGHFCTKCKELV